MSLVKKGLLVCFVLVGNVILAQSYDPIKAIAYAERWWNGFNDKIDKDTATKWGGPYVNYTKYGGDCAAFVSQCLIYGGMDLSAGSDGRGNAVKPDKVIAGAKELLQHLRDVQKFPCEAVKGGHLKAEPYFMLPGHPAILSNDRGMHAIFCTRVVDGKNVYNSHTDAAQHEKRSHWAGCPDAYYVYVGVVPKVYPAHCDNCRQDEDETGLDCGDSCPPCGDAPEYRLVDQGRLTQEAYALVNITTQGNVILSPSNTPYRFVAGNEIALSSGFEVTSSTEFSAKTTQNRNELTRNLRKACVYIPNIFTPNGDGVNDTYGLWLAGITFVSFRLAGRWGNTIVVYDAEVREDGFLPLWDGGKHAEGTYFYLLTTESYTGEEVTTDGSITVLR